MYIQKDFIKNNKVEYRQFQVNIARSAKNENSLVVLPTGMGKTVIALILIADILKKEEGKILFLAPTKPLVLQHASFLKNNLTVDDNISVFTGEIPPSKRNNIWKNTQIIVSTPQVIQNDLLNSRIALKDVSFIIFDECHHAVGDYAYVFVSDMYKKQREHRLVLGMTASPGNDISKILEVCKNLEISNIEIRTKKDPDVAPFVHNLDIDWREIKLPRDFTYAIQLLRKSLKKRLKELKDAGFIESSSLSVINRTKLLDAQKKIQKEIKGRVNPSKILFKAAKKQSEAMKINHALDLIQTQGVNALKNYFQRLARDASAKSGSKSSRALMSDNDVIEAYAYIKSLNIEHPKVNEIVKIVKTELDKNPKSRIIVFTHYRNTSSVIFDKLKNVKKVRPARFIGQAVKDNDKGLTQKQQASIVKQFRQGENNVLIATSVAEEGLDIPSTDLVVFYEPVPSEIRFIQRRGRTGREMAGKVIILITKNTPDEGYYWSAKHKEKRMVSELELLRSKLNKKFENAETLYKKENIKDQKTLKDFNNKSTKENITIFVDNREYRSNVVKNLASNGVNIEPKQLDVGDYVLSTRIGVERKDVDDYLESLMNGNLFKQIQKLRSSFSRPMLVVEGDDLFTRRNINHNAIYGSLASINVDYGIPVMRTKDSGETASLLSVIANREQKRDKKSIAIRGNKKKMSIREQQQFLIEGLPHVSSVIAKRLLSYFGSVKDIINASEKELQKVPGVGRGIASDIMKLLNSEYEKE